MIAELIHLAKALSHLRFDHCGRNGWRLIFGILVFYLVLGSLLLLAAETWRWFGL
jgi:hypothetical protein